MKSLHYLPSARAELQAIPALSRARLKAALALLRAGDPGLDVRRLQGEFRVPLQRLRVGPWRVGFYVDRQSIFVLRVFPRSAGYDWVSGWTLEGDHA